MAIETLEVRVSKLEEQVARLERDKECGKGASWLDEWFGVFKDCPDFEEAVRLGREWRESFGYDDLTEEDLAKVDEHAHGPS